MAFVQLANARIGAGPFRIRRRRAIEVLALAGTSVAFLFVLAIAFGSISA